MSQENSDNKQPLIRYVNRQQMSWRAVDVERLIGEDRPARAIWELVGRLDLRPFYRAIAGSRFSGEHEVGKRAERSEPTESSSAERVPLPAGNESLCLPGG
jgi:hypothetical protein